MRFSQVLCVLSVLCSVAFGAAWTRLDPHRVENGTVISKNSTHINFLAPDGSATSFLQKDRMTAIKAEEQRKRASSTSASGWVSSFWSWGNSYTEFGGRWTVPAAPTKNTGQIIFFFNSLEGATSGGSGSDILQPVLQYNNGQSGWTLAAWYGDQNGYVESTPYPVNPGDTIDGWIWLDSNNNWVVAGFVNGAQTTTTFLAIQKSSFENGDNQNTAQWALEVYGMSTCDQYPPSHALTLSNIYLVDGSNAVTPSWGVPGTNSAACNAGGYETSSSQVTITWSTS